LGRPRVPIKPIKVDMAGDEGGERKVTVCHKDEKSLTVGVPAEDAHLRHGDGRGAPQTKKAGRETRATPGA
jgi:hypothetical protein